MTIDVATVVAALLCLAGAPYSARLTRTVPDRENRRWYVGARRSRSVLTATATVSVLLAARCLFWPRPTSDAGRHSHSGS